MTTTDIEPAPPATPAVPDVAQMSQALAGASPDDIELTSVKWPSGGTTAFQVPDGDGYESVNILEGVVVDHYGFASLYAESYDDNPDATPNAVWIAGKLVYCNKDAVDAGVDMSVPLNEQKLAQWDTGRNGGKAINERWAIYLVRAGEFLPMRISVPPTSRKDWFNYQLRKFAAVHPTSVLLKFALSAEKNKAGQPYSKLVIAGSTDLGGDMAASYAKLSHDLKPLTSYRPPAEGNLVGTQSQEDAPKKDEGDDVPF